MNEGPQIIGTIIHEDEVNPWDARGYKMVDCRGGCTVTWLTNTLTSKDNVLWCSTCQKHSFEYKVWVALGRKE